MTVQTKQKKEVKEVKAKEAKKPKASFPKNFKKPSRWFSPQMAAWAVLLFCFSLFCILAYLLASSLISYFSHSVQPQKASLTAREGLEVSVRHANQERFLLIPLNQTEQLNQGDVVRTAQGSRAIIMSFDGTNLELSSDSEVKIEEHQVRITNFVQKEKRLVFQVVRGVIKVSLDTLQVRDYSKGLVKLVTPDNAEIFFNDPIKGNYPGGTYTVDLEGKGTTRSLITSLASNPRPIDVRAGGQLQSLQPGQRITIERGGPPLLQTGERELINNGAFIDGLDYWIERHNQGGDGGSLNGRVLPDSEVVDDGTITRAHILRYDANGNSEESLLRQELKVDVSEYASLMFRFKGRIRLQSLAGGGWYANEYPLFVRIEYKDRNNQTQVLFRGFYFKAKDSSTQTYDGRSNELLRSEQWKENNWQEFQIDLANELRQKPVYITSIEVGAAGHDFESYFTEVSLLAKN